MSAVRPNPCSACPYRRDVPSGVWAYHEYEKLRGYDAPTGEQPMASFFCHSHEDELCSGWVNVHEQRGNDRALLALRIWPPDAPWTPTDVPLFDSGNEAADHGQRDIRNPDADACRTQARLLKAYPRLRRGEEE
jgi:hypothetical protein